MTRHTTTPRDLDAYIEKVRAQLEELRARQNTALEERMLRHNDPQAGQQMMRDLILMQTPQDTARYGSAFAKFAVVRNALEQDMMNHTPTLTYEGYQAIQDSIAKAGEEKQYNDYFTSSARCDRYEDNLIMAFKAFQIEAALLQNIITRRQTAESLAPLLRAPTADDKVRLDDIARIEHGTDGTATLTMSRKYQDELADQYNDMMEKFTLVKVFTQAYDKVISEDRLYPAISMKANAIMLNLKEEGFLQYLNDDPTFFRSHLTALRESGEAITARQQERAIYPDYYDIPAGREQLRLCIKELRTESGGEPPLMTGDSGFRHFTIDSHGTVEKK